MVGIYNGDGDSIKKGADKVASTLRLPSACEADACNSLDIQSFAVLAWRAQLAGETAAQGHFGFGPSDRRVLPAAKSPIRISQPRYIVAYLGYAPLFFAGPILSFNAFVSQRLSDQCTWYWGQYWAVRACLFDMIGTLHVGEILKCHCQPAVLPTTASF